MLQFPILRWGQNYKSLETEKLHHFATGDLVAEVGQANAGLVQRDMLKMQRARDVLREIPCEELIRMFRTAADHYCNAALPVGDEEQTLDEFIRCQSATTGLPEILCRLNVEKLHHVLMNLEDILASLMRGLDLDLLSAGYGLENGTMRSYQANTPALGLVMPSNSPGVHGLWLPVLPMQIGLVIKPGSQEPWTPYRMAQALFRAGIPKKAIGIYPGSHDVGATILNSCPRSLIFGSAKTVAQYQGNPGVQVHGPGFSKILFGDDVVDDWEKHLDLMMTSVLSNSGRGCINTSSIWASRHTGEIADALAQRLGPLKPLPPEDPESALAAFTTKGVAEAIDSDINAAGGEDITAKYRGGIRLVQEERCDYLRPTVMLTDSPDAEIAKKEYLFPFVTVVQCSQKTMLSKIGPTLVATALTEDVKWRRALLDAPDIDRLNIGPIPTVKLDWMQPHEGNIVDFLYRARAFQRVYMGAE